MARLLNESQLRRLIRRTLHEGFPEFMATPSYKHPDETTPPPVQPPRIDRTQEYQDAFNASGLSCQDALLQYLHQNIKTLFDATHLRADTISQGSEYPARDAGHSGISNDITRSLRLFFIQYLGIAPEDAANSMELELRNFYLIVGSFCGLLSKPFVSQIILKASAPSEQLAQKVYNAILQFPYFHSSICPDFNRNVGQVLGQYQSTKARQQEYDKQYAKQYR
jgi:hypothetical protein